MQNAELMKFCKTIVERTILNFKAFYGRKAFGATFFKKVAKIVGYKLITNTLKIFLEE